MKYSEKKKNLSSTNKSEDEIISNFKLGLVFNKISPNSVLDIRDLYKNKDKYTEYFTLEYDHFQNVFTMKIVQNLGRLFLIALYGPSQRRTACDGDVLFVKRVQKKGKARHRHAILQRLHALVHISVGVRVVRHRLSPGLLLEHTADPQLTFARVSSE